MKVVGIVPCDWANHAYRIKQMMGSNFRLITMMRHPNPGYEYDVLGTHDHGKIRSLLIDADVIHVFLSSPDMTVQSVANLLQVDSALLTNKPMVATAFSSFWHKSGKAAYDEWSRYAGQIITATPALEQYGNMYYLPQPFDAGLVQPFRVNRSADEFSVLHCPWESGTTKGTRYIEDILHSMPGFDCLVKLRLPYKRYLAKKSKYKFYVDQIKFGDYGYNAIESMAMGQPVFVYLSDQVIETMQGFHSGRVALFNAGHRGELIMDTLLHYSNDQGAYKECAKQCIEWFENNHAYGVLKPHYTQLYQSV
ncbi:MAG: hypothetical protein ACXABY_00375 [Candidatus Thorarchaeota archaeon]|jgi:hypothetical protein